VQFKSSDKLSLKFASQAKSGGVGRYRRNLQGINLSVHSVVSSPCSKRCWDWAKRKKKQNWTSYQLFKP